MTRIRAGLVGVFGTVLLGAASGTALAQSADSTTEELIGGLNAELLAIAIPLTLLVEGILFYTVWRYRASNVDEAKPTKENRRLEITWTIATALVLLFVGFGAYSVMAQGGYDEADAGEDALNVSVYGNTYFWQFEYPDAGGNNTTVMVNSNQGELVLPKGQEIRLNVTSNDWLHAFHAPELGLKADAFPGRSNYITTTLNTEGDYQLYCAEYCGTGHSQMMATINVTDQETFDAYVENLAEEATEDTGNETAAGTNTTTTDGNTTAAAVADS
ncbi:cytochrome c oxidase subunit II [Halapricum sp. CBA1109]|uniref:cytochrome c oxidase subunit II n=1 Tax=Halapricum sp. CBA1109 TaxID=2668068 RepID=UPI0012FACEE1|nr:cytochrome c oxidase subunit II [Halapricum sp. CBA1109]MUV89710.1 cytochrome c oxidase subunit II [Halapricum sp. CBA1109]